MIDTFPAFLDYWMASRGDPLERRIKRWETEYLSPWPELRTRQIEEYRREKVDWHSVARRRIFPQLEVNQSAMMRAHESLPSCAGPIFKKAAEMFDLTFELVFVIHVGIGLGAGWATRFGGRRAVLFGLENVAEAGWTDRKMAEALVAHELGHLAHQQWRAQARLAEHPAHEGPYWRLYEEGFATRFELEVTGRVRWPTEPGWLRWCQENRRWLAAAFLRAARRHRSVRRFFGSWYRIRGHSECGYFLGQEVVEEWRRRDTLTEIAVLSEDKVRRRSRTSLLRLADTHGGNW